MRMVVYTFVKVEERLTALLKRGLILAYSPKFRSILDVAEQQYRDGNGLKHEDFWREVEAEAQ